MALRVAMAFGSMLPKGSVVTTSRDSSRAARVLKRAAMAGLNAVGIDVEDLEVATVPVTRYHVRSSACQGGVTLRLAPDDPEEVILRLLDDRGMDIGEVAQRKVERLYDREESRRVLAGEIGDIDFPSRVLELYTAELVSHVDLTELRQAKWRLVLDYAFGTASFVMPNVLAKLGADVLAVNPHVSTVGVLSYERGRHAQHVADLVRSSGADLGACIDPDGEQLTVIDDDGHVLSDGELLGCLVELVARSVPGASIAVPLDASHTLEQLAAPLGASVIRTRCSTRDLVERAVDAGAVLAGTTAGGYLFPPFLPALDGVATLVHLLSLLSARGARLSHILRGVPGSRVVRLEVPTPFEHKGAVMRGLLERGGGTVVPTLDGVEVADTTGWALAVPDPELPLTRIVAEDSDPLVAEARAAQLGEEIASLVGEAAASLRLKSLRSPA
jgi:mannose-1-phosphate guanylyltransferase/phosphomannomutase